MLIPSTAAAAATRETGSIDTIDGSDVDGLAEIDADIAGGAAVDDIEAAAEELGARPGEWVFPKLDRDDHWPRRKRHGVF